VGFKEVKKHVLHVSECVRCGDIWTNGKYVSFSVGALTKKLFVEKQLLYSVAFSTPTGAICLTDVYNKDMLLASLHKFAVIY